MTTANPALSANAFKDVPRVYDDTQVMTVQGTVAKTAFLLLCVMVTSAWTWGLYYKGSNLVGILMIVGLLGGFVVAIATVFKKEWSPITAPIYALLEGLFLGSLSAQFEKAYPGIPMQAVALTFGVLFAMLAAYASGLIKATEKFKLGVVAATGGIAVVYFISIILSLFHIQVPFIYGSGWAGILFSVFVVIIASLNFVLDFDTIQQGVRNRVPKYMEWYGAFALMITLIWLYLEILRLLSKIRSNR